MTEESRSAAAEAGPQAWLTVPEVAERLGVRVTRVHQLVRDGSLLAFRRDQVLRLPVELVPTGEDDLSLMRHLGGVLRLLRDAGYSDDEALRWLYTPDDSLPGTPAVALRQRPTEVKRRAQALGF
ncbi:MAG TPA: Rv2175c family DNA-binding protein [Cryptosporangiaceae bacterium]|nr:Rv2175c family DNA-binding protein [Cryptosporangiaceae bacterium]